MSDTENPWENAASDANWSHANFSLDRRPDDSQEQQEEEVASTIFRYLINSWHFGDVLVGVLLGIYGLILGQQGNTPKFLVVPLLCYSLLLLFRAAAGTYSLQTDRFERIGMVLSAYLSLATSFILFILSIISLCLRENLAPYISQNQHDLHLPNVMVVFLRDHEHAAWVTFLVMCCVELLRFFSVLYYRRFLLEEDEVSVSLSPLPRRTRKPWWWTRTRSRMSRDATGEPLLGSGWDDARMDEGQDNNSTFWSKLFSNKSRSSSNPRDDVSVDFASVQEDWASRSEEDPLWWTKEEGNSSEGKDSS